MSDKTDPLAGLDRHRAAVLALLMTRESNPWMDRWVEAALAAADAADCAAGIVRVDTRDQALVSRVAQNWCVHEGVGKNCQPCWFDADNFIVALRAALRETP